MPAQQTSIQLAKNALWELSKNSPNGAIRIKRSEDMKLYELFLHTEIIPEYKVVYYDYVKEERIQVNADEYTDRDITYLYADDDILYIEIENEEEVIE